MRLVRVLGHRLRSLFSRTRVERDLQREIELHLEQLAREYRSAGMSGAEAYRKARREFGFLDATKERCRDMRRVRAVEDLFRDLAYACRVLIQSPGFSLTAILSLALGVGANTAIFSLVDSVLLRMMPVRDPQQLVEITTAGGEAVSYPFFESIRDRAPVFSGVLLLTAGRMATNAIVGGGDLGEIHFEQVSNGYFDVLGVTPSIGRMLGEKDENAAVISYAFWQRSFGGDPAVVGRLMRIGGDNGPYTIVGVAAARFGGVSPGQPVDLWIPVKRSRNPGAMMFRAIGRLRPGISEATASANVNLLARQLSAEWRFEHPLEVEIAPAGSGLNGLQRRFRRPLIALLLVSALLLMMVALNVANLLLARASVRRREIGVRLSLGASRSRVILQLLTESLLLGICGSVLGVIAAPLATQFLVRFMSLSTGAVALPFAMDSRVLVFTVFVSLGVVLLFGLAPALAATRLELASLFLGASRITADRGPAGRSTLLMAAQVSISCVLVAGAVLFGRSLAALSSVDSGFDPENLLVLHLEIAPGGPNGVARVRLYDRVLDRFAGVAGVRSAAISSEVPFSGNTWTEAVNAPGSGLRRGMDRDAVLLVVSPGFFDTMRMTMVRGRQFEPSDVENAPSVAVLNEAAARYYFGSGNAPGRSFRLESEGFPKPLTVAGVVRNAKYASMKEAPVRIVYLPALQVPGPLQGANVEVRTAGDPARMADLLWRTATAESPFLRFGGFTTEQRLVNGTMAQERMLAELSGFFGLSGALLVCLGLYGLTAYQVSRRTPEIGVRVAMGAQRGDVVWMVLRGSVALVAGGCAVGLGAAIALGRLVRTLLFGVHPLDVVTLLLTPVILLAIAAAAAYWPARRAASVDPMKALRYE